VEPTFIATYILIRNIVYKAIARKESYQRGLLNMDTCQNTIEIGDIGLTKCSIDLVKYTPEYETLWDNFVSASKNGVFLFYRDYMEYHSDRFHDHSLMFFKNGKLVGLMPGNANKGILNSHEGLTFGGIISDDDMKTSMMMEIFEKLISHCKGEHFTHLMYKTIPYIYHQLPAEEDLYCLFRHKAKLIGRCVNSSVQMPLNMKYTKERIRTIKKAKSNNIVVKQSFDFETFMNIQERILLERHGAKPVHSLDEISRLAERFPNNIKLFASFKDDLMIAGSIIFESTNVAHAQYAADSDQGWSMGALDLVFDYLIADYYKDKKYFDFGGSTEKLGQILNGGLVRHKEGFGARAVTQDFYRVTI
jgi:hypothetical protein